MPIEQDRLVKALRAGEKLLAGLERVEEIMERELRLVHENMITPEQGLSNLGALLSFDALVDDPMEVRLTIEKERLRLTPSRIKANETRQRAKQRQRAERMNMQRQHIDKNGDFEL